MTFTPEQIKKIAEALAQSGEVYIGIGKLYRSEYKRNTYNFKTGKKEIISLKRYQFRPAKKFKETVDNLLGNVR